MSPTSAERPAVAGMSLEVDGVGVAYRRGVPALEDVTFALRRPGICALVGMNGAGKSTLFKTIMGFLAPSRGRVLICGRPVGWAQKQNLVAYVPQTEEVDWTFPVSVRDVVMMGRQGRMGFLRIPSARDREIVADCLARVGMSEFAGRQIGALSGGQRKRVFLARALAQQGGIMLLDEPFTGVDIRTEHAIIALLRQLRDEGHVVLVSTHNLASVPGFCDHAVLVNRRLVAFGPLAEAFTPANLSLAFGGDAHDIPAGMPGGAVADDRRGDRVAAQ